VKVLSSNSLLTFRFKEIDLMKKITKEVKSKGEVVDTVQVVEYESIPEAVKALTEKVILTAINKTVSDAACNAARAAKVRPSTPQAQLARLAKADPDVQKEVERLLAKYGKEAA